MSLASQSSLQDLPSRAPSSPKCSLRIPLSSPLSSFHLKIFKMTAITMMTKVMKTNTNEDEKKFNGKMWMRRSEMAMSPSHLLLWSCLLSWTPLLSIPPAETLLVACTWLLSLWSLILIVMIELLLWISETHDSYSQWLSWLSWWWWTWLNDIHDLWCNNIFTI